MTRVGADAVHYARGRVGGTMPDSGYCLMFVRECFDIGSYYASAIDAWNGAQWRHPGDRNPPMGVPLFFLSPSIYDHVTFGGDPGGGETITTFNADIVRYGGDAIAGIERDFDATYLGWTEDLNTVRVWTPPGDPGGDDDMPSADEVARAVWEYPIQKQGTGVGWGPGPAWSWLADSRNAAMGVWDVSIGPRSDVGVGPGPGPARDWLADARNAAIDASNTPPPATSWQASAALVVALALLVGLVVALVLDARDGVLSGGGVLVGGIVSLVLGVARRRRGAHRG